MVLPIIAAGIGVVSTIASLKAQSDATAANNRAVAGQIYAEQKSEEIRKKTAAFQTQQVKEQAKLETAQRRAAFREQDNALQLAAIQVEAERAVIAAKAAAQTEVNRRQLRDTALTLSQDEANTRVNTRKQRADLLTAMSQQSTVAQLEQPVNNSRANTDAALAASRLGGGVTSANIRKASTNEDTINAALQASLSAEAVKERELEAFDRSAVRSDFTQNLQRGLELGSAVTATADADSRIADGVALNEKLATLNQASIANQRAQARTSRNITATNARMGNKLTVAELRANSNLAAARSAMSQAQLSSQMQRSTNFGTAVASVLQSALPLVSAAVPRAQVRTPSAASDNTFGTTNALNYELYARSGGSNFAYTTPSTSGTFSTYSR